MRSESNATTLDNDDATSARLIQTRLSRGFVSLFLAGPRVGDRCHGRLNNFDALRFCAAIAVIIAHAYPLSTGSGTTEPFDRLTGGQMSLGTLAVNIFFVISGFLITQSFVRKPDILRFLLARVLRIFPGLAIATACVALFLGPIVTSLSLSNYFTDERTYAYFLTVLLHDSANRILPGVFIHNAFPDVVNGSTWTLEAEFLCYLVVAILGVLRLLEPKVVLGLLALSAVQPFVHILPIGYPWLTYLDFFRFFSAGMLLFLWRERIPVRPTLVMLASFVLIVSAVAGRGFNSLSVPFGSYLVICAALPRSPRFAWWGKHGDFSYGIYIYAFPIQQTLVHFAGGTMSPYVNMLVAIPLTIAVAAASWHFIEKRALAFKEAREHRPVKEPRVAAIS